jgi:hypothetical protein
VNNHFQEGPWVGKENCRSLGFPGFPVDLVGVDRLHAVFSYGKPHTRLCPVQRGRKSGFARDDKGEGSAHLSNCDKGWTYLYAEREANDPSIHITTVEEGTNLPFVIPSEPGRPIQDGGDHQTACDFLYGKSLTLLRFEAANGPSGEAEGSAVLFPPPMAPPGSDFPQGEA